MEIKSFFRIAFPFLIILILSLPPAYGLETENKFLFPEDQELLASDPSEFIITSDDLETSQYLSKPLTRLDFIIFNLNSNLDKFVTRHEESLIESCLNDFEPRIKSGFNLKCNFTGGVTFHNHTKKIHLHYLVNAGKPQKPLKQICKSYFIFFDEVLPKKYGDFYVGIEFALGTLIRDNLKDYYPIVDLITKQTVKQVILKSEYDDNLYEFICYKVGNSQSLYFKKQVIPLRY